MPIRFDSIVGVSQKPENRPVYRMSVSLAMLDSETGITAEAGFNSDIVGIASPTQEAQHFGLLGRDFLVPFCFVYDGPKGEFEIQIRQPIPTGTLPAAPGATAPLNRKQRRAQEREARKVAKRDRRGG